MMRQSIPNDGNHFHSSGYASAAHGRTIGAASTQSYSERLQIERNRQHVRRYGHSILGRVDSLVRPRIASSGSETVRARLDTGAARPLGVQTPRPGGFQEPPTRSYNPYK